MCLLWGLPNSTDQSDIGWRSWRTHFVTIFDLRKNASDKFAFGVRMFLGPPAKVYIAWYVKWLCWGNLFQDSLTCLEWHFCVHIWFPDVVLKNSVPHLNRHVFFPNMALHCLWWANYTIYWWKSWRQELMTESQNWPLFGCFVPKTSYDRRLLSATRSAKILEHWILFHKSVHTLCQNKCVALYPSLVLKEHKIKEHIGRGNSFINIFGQDYF